MQGQGSPRQASCALLDLPTAHAGRSARSLLHHSSQALQLHPNCFTNVLTRPEDI